MTHAFCDFSRIVITNSYILCRREIFYPQAFRISINTHCEVLLRSAVAKTLLNKKGDTGILKIVFCH